MSALQWQQYYAAQAQYAAAYPTPAQSYDSAAPPAVAATDEVQPPLPAEPPPPATEAANPVSEAAPPPPLPEASQADSAAEVECNTFRADADGHMVMGGPATARPGHLAARRWPGHLAACVRRIMLCTSFFGKLRHDAMSSGSFIIVQGSSAGYGDPAAWAAYYQQQQQHQHQAYYGNYQQPQQQQWAAYQHQPTPGCALIQIELTHVPRAGMCTRSSLI